MLRSSAAQTLPFQKATVVRRTAPCVAAGSLSLLLIVDTGHFPAWRLALAAIGLTVVASFTVLPWERLPRAVVYATFATSLLLLLIPVGGTAATLTLVAGAGILAMGLAYLAPWDRLPRWTHDVPPFVGIVAIL